MIKVLREAHQEVPPELERYAFSSGGGNGGGRGYGGGRRYGGGGRGYGYGYGAPRGMTGSNNIPVGGGNGGNYGGY